MKSILMIFALLAPIANAQAETLNQEGVYTGNLGPGVRGICRVEITNAKSGWFGKLKSAELSSTILGSTEVVSLKCKSHISEGFSCAGHTEDGVLVILYPDSIRFEGEGAYVKGPRLVVYEESGARSCEELSLID